MNPLQQHNEIKAFIRLVNKARKPHVAESDLTKNVQPKYLGIHL